MQARAKCYWSQNIEALKEAINSCFGINPFLQE